MENNSIDYRNLHLYTLVDLDGTRTKQYYYFQVNDSALSLKERIIRFCKILFDWIASSHDRLVSEYRSRFREVITGKKEICLYDNDSDFFRNVNSVDQLSTVLGSIDRWHKHYPKLSLTNMGLNALPESICKLRNLQELILTGNSLTTLPKSIEKLVNLKIFFLSRNQMTTFPESIVNLPNLEMLWGNWNQFTSLPETIEKLSKLESLYLDNNLLIALPENIGKLGKLNTLSLSNNQLSTLPGSIVNFSNLEFFSLAHNQFTILPEFLGNLSKLEQLYLNNNQLTTLPESIEKFSNLKTLDLSNNRFTSVPPCIYRLPQSCYVNVYGNPLGEDEITAIIERTSQPNYRGPRHINFSSQGAERNSSEAIVPPLSEFLNEWCSTISEEKLLRRLDEEQKNSLANWLTRLKVTKDYKNRPDQTITKIKTLLDWLAQESDESVFGIALTIIKDATDSCNDNISLGVNHLSVLMKISQSIHLNLIELKDFIISIIRYEMLTDIANKKCDRLIAVDPIEVHLAYSVKLKDELNLPLEVEEMIFGHYSQVTAEDILVAKEQILKETDPTKHLEILSEHPIWKIALEKSSGFAELKNACAQKKAEALANIDRNSKADSEAYMKEFKAKEKAEWNPHYLMTKQLIASKE